MGQANKLRHCPATGGNITSAECGGNRHGRYACPAGCPYDPFAPSHYTTLLEHESRLDAALSGRLVDEDEGAVAALAAAARSNSGHGPHATAVWRLFYQRDRDGRTLAARWEAAGFPGLKNDDRVFLRGKMQTRVALIEIRQVLDEQTFDALDLLEPGRPVRRFIDRQVAARAVRFSVILTWAYPLPHFWRVSGTGVVLPEFGDLEPDETVRLCIEHLGGPTAPGEARTRWLTENFTRIDETILAASLERRRLMFDNLDAQFGFATYELAASFPKCRAALVVEPNVEPDELSAKEQAEGFAEAMVWFEERAAGNSPAVARAAHQVKGRILLGPKKWRLEALGAARFAELRSRFEARLGARMRFSTERRDDLGARMAAQDQVVDAAAVPPRLLEQPSRLDLQSSRLPAPPPGVSLEDYQEQIVAEYRRTLIDSPIPALDGLTPRAAAQVAALRSKLLHLMKGHVRHLDEHNLRTGRSDDFNQYLRELGLFEIDVPPPPLRVKPPADDIDGGDDDDLPLATDENFLEAETGRPAAPRLIGPPLTLSQAYAQLDAVMDSLATARSGLDEMDRSGAFIIQDMAELSEEKMSEDEFNYFVTFVIQAWFVLVPKGVRAPELNFEAMEAAMVFEESRLRPTSRPASGLFNDFLRDGRQPALLTALTNGLVESADKVPKKIRPSPAAIISMMILLKVGLNELDRALRA